VKIAAAQISCTPGDLVANLGKIREFVSRAKKSGIDLIVFPEMVDTGYAMPAIQKHATSWNEGAVPELQKIAKEFSIAIIAGVSERNDSRIYNAQALIDANGEVLAKYRKTHLVTAAPLDERPVFTPGEAFASCKIDPPSRSSVAAGKFNLGLTICYDLRFPEVCRKLAVQNKVNVFICSSAWPLPRVEHLRILALTRAIENQSYLVLANRVGADDGVTFCGTSAIIDPYGVILAAASADREELIQAEISKDVIDSVRSRMAVFDHRRPDLY
jgi:omega-amidase